MYFPPVTFSSAEQVGSAQRVDLGRSTLWFGRATRCSRTLQLRFRRCQMKLTYCLSGRI